jgi:hypothetical protein
MACYTLTQMLDRANQRDLNQGELEALEALVDAAGIEAVMQGLSEICGLKADHIAEAWQGHCAGQAMGDDGRSARRCLYEGNGSLDSQPSASLHTSCARMQALTPTTKEPTWLKLIAPYIKPTSAQACPSPPTHWPCNAP